MINVWGKQYKIVTRVCVPQLQMYHVKLRTGFIIFLGQEAGTMYCKKQWKWSLLYHSVK